MMISCVKVKVSYFSEEHIKNLMFYLCGHNCELLMSLCSEIKYDIHTKHMKLCNMK